MDFVQTFADRITLLCSSIAFVALRLPGLLIIDLWFRLNLGNDVGRSSIDLNDKVAFVAESLPSLPFIKLQPLDSFALDVLGYAALAFGASLLLLPFARLVSVYLHICTVLLLAACHYLSNRYVQSEIEVGGEIILDELSKLERHGFHFLAQVCLAVVMSCLLGLRNAPARASLTIYAAPIVARMFGVKVEYLRVVHNFSCSFMMLIIAFYILNTVPVILSHMKEGVAFTKSLVRQHGVAGALYELGERLMVLDQLAAFWALLIVVHLLVRRHALVSKEWYIVALVILSQSSSTPASLLGFAVAVAYSTRLTLLFTKLYLQGFEAMLSEHNLLHNGYAEGTTVLLLAFQTGLLELSTAQRALLTAIILFIVISSVLQSVYEIADPVLLTLGASRQTGLLKHVKALFFCLGLMIFPVAISLAITFFLPTDFWLLVIISSCVITSLQSLTSIVIYSFFLYDAAQKESWERLDDMIFCCRSLTRICEFLVAVVVIAYGVYESIFGEWSWTNSTILVIHCYFNVFQRLQLGWKTFLLRRQALKMITSFPNATKEQLDRLRDVCSICFQDMTAARVLPCGHLFHGACLRKWLYVKQSCPLCHCDVKKPAAPPVETDNASASSWISTDDSDSERDRDGEVDRTRGLIRRVAAGGISNRDLSD